MDWLFSLQPECLYPSEGISRWADRGDSHYLQLCYAPAAKGKCWGASSHFYILNNFFITGILETIRQLKKDNTVLTKNKDKQ